MAVKDPLKVPKIMVCSSVASLVELYLRKFQSSKPMMPFVYRELVQVFHSSYSRFLKQEVIEDANKLAEKSPLNCKIISAVSILDPNYIISSKVNAEKKFKKFVEILYERDWIASVVTDNAKQQFFNLTSCAKAKLNEKFDKFKESDSRLDDFYYDIFGQDKSYKDLRFVIKIVLIFSHGQAYVESGFQSIAQLCKNIYKKNRLFLNDLSMIQLILLVEFKKLIRSQYIIIRC